MPFPTEMYRDGHCSKSIVCPSGVDYHRYLIERYKLVADAAPDFIWVDDDIRMQGMEGLACFCPQCLGKFDGGRWRREDLVVQLDAPGGSSTRASWLGFSISQIDYILKIIADTVHSIDAAIDISMMSGGVGGVYTPEAMRRWHTTLGGRRARPGGVVGFYSDSTPGAMLQKSIAVCRQCVAYPAFVTDIQYEVENFPYQKLSKSIASVLNESVLAFASGSNGIAFNVLKDLPGSLEPYDELFTAIEAARPSWDLFLSTLPGSRTTGLHIPERPDEWVRRPEVEHSVGQYSNIDPTQVLMEIGIPVTRDPAGAVATVLCGDTAAFLDDEEIEEIFAGGVLIDSHTVKLLSDRGLSGLTGVQVEKCFDNGVYERFLDHPLNQPYADDARDTRISFWKAPADTLTPIDEHVEPLARLIGYDRSDLGVCATAYVNRLGGRVVALGYAPWTYIHSSAKRTQVLNYADWVSFSRLPTLISKVTRVTQAVRANDDSSRLSAVLLNTSFDDSGELEVRLRTSAPRVSIINSGGPVELKSRRAGSDAIVTIPSMAPWRHLLLTAGGI
ncbi:MAG TPA: hypothetical protein VGK19_08575 [Capsulimonadaceae bacterium]